MSHLNTVENLVSIFDYCVPYEVEKNKSSYVKDSVEHGADVIKDLETLKKIKDFILNNTGKYGLRNFMIFVFGLNVGRRCGDTLKLKIGDIYDFHRNEVKDRVVHIEQKTGKRIGFYIPEKLKPILFDYINGLEDICEHTPLFRSQKGEALGRKSYWRILKDVQKGLDLNLNLGTHSCRKTFGYFTFKTLKDNGDALALQTVREIFGHSAEKITSGYIGLTDDTVRNAYNSVIL